MPHHTDYDREMDNAATDDFTEQMAVSSLLLKRMDRDIRQAIRTMTPEDLRFLVDRYYQAQENRKRSYNQAGMVKRVPQSKRVEKREPHVFMAFLAATDATIERFISAAIKEHPLLKTVPARWCQAQYGIAHILTAGLLVHIDITKCLHVNQLHAFAGLIPTQVWLKGQRRPWNAALKTLAYKAGDCFVKFQNRPECFYGQFYAKRKRQEWEANISGRFVGIAREREKTVGRETHAWKWYNGCVSRADALTYVQEMAGDGERTSPPYGTPGSGQPMLPPAHIQMRSQRAAVKLFLSHLHHVLYEDYYQEPPPELYEYAHLNHDVRGFIPPPHWPLEGRQPKTKA